MPDSIAIIIQMDPDGALASTMASTRWPRGKMISVVNFGDLLYCNRDSGHYEGCIWDMGMGQNPIPLVNLKIAGKWMFIPLKMVCIGIDPYPYDVDMMEYGTNLRWFRGVDRVFQRLTCKWVRYWSIYGDVLGVWNLLYNKTSSKLTQLWKVPMFNR